MTKVKCLRLLAANNPGRGYVLTRAKSFLGKFPWLAFILQAPQAAYTLTGYGVVLGAFMGLVTDVIWTPVRLFQGKKIRIDTWVPAAEIEKAGRLLSQPAYEMGQSQGLSYEDHWLLLAARIVAMRILMEAAPAVSIEPRVDLMLDSPVIDYEPWYPPTIEALRAEGWQPGTPQLPPIAGLTAESTYRQTLERISGGFEDWLFAIQRDFPRGRGSGAFVAALSEAGEDFFNWANDGEASIKPVFEPEELAIARMFEVGIVPNTDPGPELVEQFLERAFQLARAMGRDIPGRWEWDQVRQEFGPAFFSA